ncbi:helix-turn-helix domain-containing protein [Streptomyces sp. S07_1.15]|uniref:helix-turn-helix domain-containing protein n=1 Tax=Streptomyces sp. S07_1.15 TaxID=2873925 RepID=UPI001D1487EC|nr:helix-turn-helix transcriptional regulator [Streptomyces sp. S07_1.15]MCC3655349.1 helix-turn-helix domain-containing protein [Streptomyces sp. S07_1.15]
MREEPTGQETTAAARNQGHPAADDFEHRDDGAGTGIVTAFGRQLKLLRTRAGLERPQLGSLTNYSASSIASFEQGRRIPLPRFIDRADEVLGAGGLLKALKEEVERAQYPSFFRDAARLEAGATALYVYAVYAVPGLLQTEDYARAGFRLQRPLLDEDIIEQRLSARMARQEVHARRPAPLLSFIIEEAAVRRPIGGRTTLREQWEKMLRLGQLRNVEIQIMPTEREDHAALGGPFTLIDTSTGRRVAYTEVQDDSRLYMEQAKIRELETRYGILRSQALTPRESSTFVERLLGES